MERKNRTPPVVKEQIQSSVRKMTAFLPGVGMPLISRGMRMTQKQGEVQAEKSRPQTPCTRSIRLLDMSLI